MDTSISSRLEAASLAVQSASRLAKGLQKSLSDVTSINKQDRSPVTIGDFAIQALLTSILHTVFPEDRFLAEESADALRENAELRRDVWDLITSSATRDQFDFSLVKKKAEDMFPTSEEQMLDLIDMGGKNTDSSRGRVWIMDPIDGTATFMRGQQFCINCSLLVDGSQAIGLIGCPNLPYEATSLLDLSVNPNDPGCLVAAIKDHGTWVRRLQTEGGNLGHAKRVERHGENTTQADLKWTDDASATSTIHHQHRLVASQLKMAWPGADLHSSVMKYAVMGLGLANVCIRIFKHRSYISNVWDHAGGNLVYAEAGGQITDCAGKEIDFSVGRKMKNNFGLVCAPTSVHPVVLRAVQQIMKDNGS